MDSLALMSHRHSACVLVVLFEGAAPQMVHSQTKNDHLEMIIFPPVLPQGVEQPLKLIIHHYRP
jgi:hypothetical protein